MGRRDPSPGPGDYQPELWTGPPRKSARSPYLISATVARLSATAYRGGPSEADQRSGIALLTPQQERWPESQSTAKLRQTPRSPPPFEVGWGDMRTTGHRDAAPRPGSAPRGSRAGRADSRQDDRASHAAASELALREKNLALRMTLEAVREDNDRLRAELQARDAEARALAEENARLNAKLEADEEASAALRQMGLGKDAVGDAAGEGRLEVDTWEGDDLELPSA